MSELSESDIDQAVDILTEDELRNRLQDLDKAQTYWEETAYVVTPKIPCPECTGAGSISGGSLGNACPTCHGQRVIADPNARQIQYPPFAELRRQLSEYADKQIFLALPADHAARKGKDLALPPAASLPTREQIAKLVTEAKQLRSLGAGSGPDLKSLPSREPGVGIEGDAEEDGSYDDDALDAMEDGRGR
jgi:hypothetical protein